MQEDSEFIRHEACPHCGSSDANALYSNGNHYCFSCQTLTPADGQEIQEMVMPKANANFLEVTPQAFGKRRISEATSKHWKYGVSEYHGSKVQVANYYDDHGTLQAQKVRFPNKDFTVIGDLKKAGLYGQNLCRDGGKMITIVEGELDALSLSQAFGNKWPVVSIPSGIDSAKKAIGRSIEWLSKYDSIILMFDNDEVGQAAALDVASILPPNKAKIAKLPLKDASDMLQAGRTEELINAVWGAKTFRPDGIVSGVDLWDVVTSVDERASIPYPYTGLNEKVGGCRKGEIVTLTAGSGIGKSQLARELAHSLIKNGETVGYIALEENVKRTALGLMSIEMNRLLHLQSNEDVSTEEMKEAFDATVGSGRVYLYDHWGSTDSDNLLSKIRYLVRGCGCNFIVLDHISIVVSGLEGGDERRIIDNTMTKLRGLVEELNCGMILISHLKRPSGDRGHEDGAQTSLAQLRGSAAIGQLSDIVIGLERNQQDKDNSNISDVRVLKNRWSGDTGIACHLAYSVDTGRMTETYWDDEDEVEIDF
ncbi:toprim domain-containing protein [bacterium]|nr:toprim domain-containing protein [bacterium]MDB4350094.1 toprim domain-containing protein [bacterium]